MSFIYELISFIIGRVILERIGYLVRSVFYFLTSRKNRIKQKSDLDEFIDTEGFENKVIGLITLFLIFMLIDFFI